MLIGGLQRAEGFLAIPELEEGFAESLVDAGALGGMLLEAGEEVVRRLCGASRKPALRQRFQGGEHVEGQGSLDPGRGFLGSQVFQLPLHERFLGVEELRVRSCGFEAFQDVPFLVGGSVVAGELKLQFQRVGRSGIPRLMAFQPVSRLLGIPLLPGRKGQRQEGLRAIGSRGDREQLLGVLAAAVKGEAQHQGCVGVLGIGFQHHRSMPFLSRHVALGERQAEQRRMGLGVAGIQLQALLPERRHRIIACRLNQLIEGCSCQSLGRIVLG
ncbi:hypothetical protein D3C87_646030 [compost metagenome]